MPRRSLVQLSMLALAAAAAGLATWQLAAQSAASSSLCTVVPGGGGTGTGSALSTFSGGTVRLGNWSDTGGRCALAFENFTAVNTTSSLFAAQGSSSASTYCKDSGGQRIVASGSHVAQQNLPTFQSGATTFDVKLLNSVQASVGNNAWMPVVRGLLTVPVLVDGRVLNIAPTGAEFVLPGGDAYRTLSVENGNKLTLSAATGSTPTRIQNLSLSGCNSTGGLTVAPGDYFIENLSIAAGCRISVSGSSGRVNFYVKNGLTIYGGPTCINFPLDASSRCDSTSTALAKPERFNLSLYSGNLATQGDLSIAGALYVHAGSFSAGDGGKYRIVGEVLAQSISMLGNDGTVLRYQDTGVFLQPASLRNGEYALAATAVPPTAVAGDLAYLPSQRDFSASGGTAYSGTLYAHAIAADGSIAATPTWDAAALMSVADRSAKFWTQSSAATPTLVALGAVDDAAFGAYSAVAAELRQAIPDPAALGGKYLAGRDPLRRVGRLHRTAPVIAGPVVAFAAEDGLLYAVDKLTGALKWGFIPRQVLPSTGNPAAMIRAAVWGQLAYVTSGGSGYITGTVLGGRVHLALKIDVASGALQSIAWVDDASPATSPASPYGGEAPLPALTAESPVQVYYVVGNRIRQRPVDGSGSVTTRDLGALTVTSAPVVQSAAEIYLGAYDGQVYRTAMTATTAPTAVFTVDSGEAVLTLGGMTHTSASGSQLLLAATSSDTLAVRAAAASTPAWSTTLGSSSASVVPTLPTGARLTAPATLTPDGKLLLPVTIGSTCFEQAYELGPLELNDGSPVASVKLRQVAVSAALNLVGYGEALTARYTQIGSRRFGIASAGGGNPSGSAVHDARGRWGELEWGRRSYRIQQRNWKEVTRDLP